MLSGRDNWRIKLTNQTSKITIDNIRNEIYRQAKREAENWFYKQTHIGLSNENYLYYKPSTENEYGELRIEANAPDGFTLATAKRITINNSVDTVIQFIRDNTSSLPIVPFGR
jgi:hypothetical protein